MERIWRLKSFDKKYVEKNLFLIKKVLIKIIFEEVLKI